MLKEVLSFSARSAYKLQTTVNIVQIMLLKYPRYQLNIEWYLICALYELGSVTSIQKSIHLMCDKHFFDIYILCVHFKIYNHIIWSSLKYYIL